MKTPAIIDCREEEYAFFLSALWRLPRGWRPILFPLRGPGSIGFFGSLVGIILFSRRPARFCHSASEWRGAKVIEVSTALGDYGMGGYAFVGIRMQRRRARRWLVFPLFAAASWFTLNGKPPCESLSQDELDHYRERRPSSLHDLVGSELEFLKIDDESLRLRFERPESGYEIVLRRDGRDIKLWPRGGRRRLLPQESLEDSLLICQSPRLWS